MTHTKYLVFFLHEVADATYFDSFVGFFLNPGFEEDILIVSEGKMAPFTHDFRKAQQRMPAIPVNIHSMNFTWQAAGQVSSYNRKGWRKLPFPLPDASRNIV